MEKKVNSFHFGFGDIKKKGQKCTQMHLGEKRRDCRKKIQVFFFFFSGRKFFF